MIDEGYIKFGSAWNRSPPLDPRLVSELLVWRRPLFAAGLVGRDPASGVSYGNLSVRVGDTERFVISGTQTGHIGAPGPEHFALVTRCDIAGNRVVSEGASEASSESMSHGALYQVSPSTRAVVHVHDPDTWQQQLHRIPTADANVAFGTPEMAAELRMLLAETDFATQGVAAMAGHEAGLIAIGSTLEEACRRILALCAKPARSPATAPVRT